MKNQGNLMYPYEKKLHTSVVFSIPFENSRRDHVHKFLISKSYRMQFSADTHSLFLNLFTVSATKTEFQVV